jgi:hypothetical protein
VGTGDRDNAHPWLQDGFLLSVGGFLQRKEVKLSARASLGGEDRAIDFGHTFKGGDRENVAALNFHWRFRDKWWLSAEIYSTRFREGAVLEEDVYWRDVIFPAGSYAAGGFSTDLYRVVAGREIFRTQRSEMGVGLGLHWLELGAFIEGEILFNGETLVGRREAVSLSAPLPNVSLWYIYGWSSKWAASARWDWFAASIDEYSGNLTNLSVGVIYQLTPHLGVSLSYKRFRLALDVEKRGWYGQIEYRQTGPFLAVSANW